MAALPSPRIVQVALDWELHPVQLPLYVSSQRPVPLLLQALGVSAELRDRGYALMCVGYPLSDLELETVEEDEVYDLQFGRAFAEMATNPNTNSVMRDDFALELADMDE